MNTLKKLRVIRLLILIQENGWSSWYRNAVLSLFIMKSCIHIILCLMLRRMPFMEWATLAATWSKILSCLFIRWIKVTVKFIDTLFLNAWTVYSEDVTIRHELPVHLRSQMPCMLNWVERTLVITQQSWVPTKWKICPHIISALQAKVFMLFFKIRGCVQGTYVKFLYWFKLLSPVSKFCHS